MKGATITLDASLSGKKFAKVLAHEVGHGGYTITHKARAKNFPGNPALKGHDKGNESGNAADDAEKEFDKNYKAAMDALEEERKRKKDHL